MSRKRKLEQFGPTRCETNFPSDLKSKKHTNQNTTSPISDINPYRCGYCPEDVEGNSYTELNSQGSVEVNTEDVQADHWDCKDGQEVLPQRWLNLKNIFIRSGPFKHPAFKPSSLLFKKLKCVKVLVVGAGGLGSEILKNLAMMGFANLHVIDMDTVDLSNLNRQFLFQKKDIGLPKVEVAAEYIKKRVPGCNINTYFNKIEDFDQQFYKEFSIVVCGLDTIWARRWMSGMLLSLFAFEEDDELSHSSSVIPLVDGGTEGFKGISRIVLPGISPCADCTTDLYPPQTKYHLCTLANTPRLPEHCVEYVKLILWPRENPWGKDTDVDEDDPQHLNWVYEKSLERAVHYGISGITYELVLGVMKNIIPAVASTNAVIGAVCAMEAFKIVTNCFLPMRNHLFINVVDGIYAQPYELEINEQCSSCSSFPLVVEEDPGNTLAGLISLLKQQFMVKNPTVTVNIKGKFKMLYMPTVPTIEEKTRVNLNKTLKELGFQDTTEFMVADKSFPKTMYFKLQAIKK